MRGTLNKKIALVVGSAPAAEKLCGLHLPDCKSIALNNAWRVPVDFDYLFYPSDFPEERRAPASYPAIRISSGRYEKAIREAGGLLFVGSTIAIMSGYWACAVIRPAVLGFFACDMVYSGDRTHFYGAGTADPLRTNISLRSLEAKSARQFVWALLRGTLSVNCSTEPSSRLVLPRVETEDLKAVRFLASHPEWDELKQLGRSILAREKKAPVDPLRPDYWNYRRDRAAVAFVDKIDARWKDTIPLIEAGWRKVGPSRPRLWMGRVLRRAKRLARSGHRDRRIARSNRLMPEPSRTTDSNS